jgi:ribosomal protein S18 acetylase RimI-like enzyme
MNINNVILKEIDCVMLLIEDAIREMERNRTYQWDEIYPDGNVILGDITSSSLYAARKDHSIAGIIALNENQSPEYNGIPWSGGDGHPLIVHRLCIPPSFQGQGLAKLLMQLAEDYARRNKFGSIRLDAFIDNKKAVGLYDSLNYQRKGIVKFRKGDFYCYEKLL